MSFEWTDEPAQAGLDSRRFELALDLVRMWCESGEVPGAAVVVGRSHTAVRPRFFGRQHPDRQEPLRPDAIFTVASITKPIVAMGVLLLVERGVLALSDRVADMIPEFAGRGRYGIRLRHLLTHTSGLPDLLPHDRDLRRANAPLEQYLADICRIEPAFIPGRSVSYSSCGYVLLGEVVRRQTGLALPDFLREELFRSLGMRDTALGAPAGWFEGAAPSCDRFAAIRVPEEQVGGEGWNWNSGYWRTLGAPWGGLLSTPADLAVFARMLLTRGQADEHRLVSEATIEAATTNQLGFLRDLPENERRCRPWGLGWRMHWPGHGAYFGDLLGPRAYGHWGATGTLLWVDPERDAFAVLLTTQPQDPDGRYLARLSNAIVAALR